MVEESPALKSLDASVQKEYEDRLREARAEFRVVEGTTAVHGMLLERFCFCYALMRSKEADLESLDMQRQNQLLGIWLKIGSDLLSSYRELYTKTVVNEMFVQKIVDIVTEEVEDPEALARIRTRLKNALSDE